MTLPEKWIERIFARLQGIYGAQFTSKFSRMDQGVDVGMLNAKSTWADELGNFSDKPEAIAYALDHLPTDHAPNALEFRDICRRAPKKKRHRSNTSRPRQTRNATAKCRTVQPRR